jgi:hypothetical protein
MDQAQFHEYLAELDFDQSTNAIWYSPGIPANEQVWQGGDFPSSPFSSHVRETKASETTCCRADSFLGFPRENITKTGYNVRPQEMIISHVPSLMIVICE